MREDKRTVVCLVRAVLAIREMETASLLQAQGDVLTCQCMRLRRNARHATFRSSPSAAAIPSPFGVLWKSAVAAGNVQNAAIGMRLSTRPCRLSS
eukprot:650074-Pelagomonas_calceolata.AAC.1